MRAMTYDRYGDNAVLELTELPTPKVGPGQILVRVTRASVNPVDWKVMAGGLDAMMDAHFPVVPGWDVAGVVEQIGPDTPEFAVGDRVASYGRKMVVSGGTFAEYVTLPAEFATMIPDGVTDDAAAALPLTGLTAKRSIEALDLSDGDTVLIHAASGGVGYLASQLALAKGATVIGTASEANAGKLTALGVTPVAYGDGLEDRVREIAPDGVDAVADYIGDVLDVTLAVLTEGGRHVSITDPAVTEHGGRWLWVRPDAAGLAELLRLVDAGELTLDIDRTYPLDQVAEAFRVSQAGEAKGKLLIDVTR
ncbi:NADP-dependent oxidoreductase [Tersicoccus sp. Bi-70]|uniref:NADP-dependent oxidoreductase n=1 Tax=Tersicoccus sp. Bi-70 TaxID=1897634 RepID=UPI000977424D|nr:NADP-dependent oxidoreductase [Tersicoccus sp. Bi-70]OMH35264.1 alcohol dehydrogenase [Tersicoccus sp. Bi-70]